MNDVHNSRICDRSLTLDLIEESHNLVPKRKKCYACKNEYIAFSKCTRDFSFLLRGFLVCYHRKNLRDPLLVASLLNNDIATTLQLAALY